VWVYVRVLVREKRGMKHTPTYISQNIDRSSSAFGLYVLLYLCACVRVYVCVRVCVCVCVLVRERER